MLAKTKIEGIMFDKETIIGFLESKDPNEKYHYINTGACAFAQFLIEYGHNPKEFYSIQKDCLPPGVWHEIARPSSKRETITSTFGQALKRARKLLK